MCNNFSLFIEIDIHFLITRVPPDSTKATRYPAWGIRSHNVRVHATDYEFSHDCQLYLIWKSEQTGMGQKIKVAKIEEKFSMLRRF